MKDQMEKGCPRQKAFARKTQQPILNVESTTCAQAGENDAAYPKHFAAPQKSRLKSVASRRIAQAALSMGMFGLLLGVAACGGKRGGQDESTIIAVPQDTAAQLVSTSRASIDTVTALESYTAQVMPFEENSITAGIAARIQSLKVDVGDRVHKGQVLVQMDPTTLLQQQAQLATLELNYRRIDTLRKVGSASQQQYDQLKTQYEVTKAAVANLARNTTLTSPIDGVVTGRYASEGDLFTMAPSAAAGGKAAILTVMQINPVKVLFSAPEVYYSRLKKGQRVVVTIDAYGEERFRGAIYRIAPSIDPVTHTFITEVTVPNNNGKIRPGMFARAHVDFGRRARVLVPDLAVNEQRGSDNKYVFTVVDGTAHRVEVTTGGHYDDRIEVLTGLKGGEEVVVAGAATLRAGAKLKVKNAR